jgi:Uma2 family endonuclease
MTVATQRRMSLEDYLTYDDGTDARYELVDGVLVEMGAESRCNIKIALFLIKAFLRLVDYDRLGIKEKIQVDSEYVSARDPDLIVHSEGSALAIEGRKESCLFLNEPNPMIVVEVVSPGKEDSENYDRDYEHKRDEYAARGIPEYWIVDPATDRAWVKVGTLANGAYQFQDFTGNQVIQSPAFPSLTLTAIEVLTAGR